MNQKIGTLLYQGKTREIWSRIDQKQGLLFAQEKFFVSVDLAKDFEKVTSAFDRFCKEKMVSIIEKGIEKYRWKTVRTQLPYTNGTKSFFQQAQLSAQEYLKLIGYSTKIDYQIGKYTKEWGINEIKTGQKSFTLYFNLDLIKYDAGDKILLVVAHEMAHIFHRDHGAEFQDVLEQMYPNKREAENFFNTGISSLFGGKADADYTKYIFIFAVGALGLILGSMVLNGVSSFLLSNLGFSLPGAGTSRAPKF